MEQGRRQIPPLASSPTTSHSDWSGSRRSPACRGRSWPARRGTCAHTVKRRKTAGRPPKGQTLGKSSRATSDKAQARTPSPRQTTHQKQKLRPRKKPRASIAKDTNYTETRTPTAGRTTAPPRPRRSAKGQGTRQTQKLQQPCQTRCPSCADKNRESRIRSNAKRKATA